MEREIEQVRARLDRSLAELDRRRRELTDLRLQARRHPAIAVGAGVLLLAATAGVGFLVLREKPQLDSRREPSFRGKILAGVCTVVAMTMAKRLLEWIWNAVPTYTNRRSPAALRP